ncbi:MAG: hypothetical protein HY925_11760 [Elusimicrobia bacterium]|nr:hypothetical protein [Elusimicrobiota bacterium]
MRKCDVLSALFVISISASAASARLVSEMQRLDGLKRAKVWQAVEVEKMDLLNGPEGYKAGEEIPCKYEEKDPLKPLGGHSRKFPCWDKSNNRLKVKYGADKNHEVFGEVAGSRFFWALGFYSDPIWSVKIKCENCPEDPFVSQDGPRATRVFEPATVQKRLKGEDLQESADQGWTFDELDKLDPAKGGSSKAEVDALRLLAVFVNHGDNTTNQQRLICPDGDAKCKSPIAYATDLGGVFGGTNNETSFHHWTKKTSLWKDKSKCIADFKPTWQASANPKISEGGRKFLADLMGRLSEQQIRDLFKGARFDTLGQYENPIRTADGRSRRVTVDDWTKALLKRREELISTRCPE